ncbi:hypothetical protein ACFOWX_08310 [Sphingorhabdus arenilitoris]|uniref:Lipoprotein n=1 Tax=Sphingorhabdus arenilitoris TaxID=1490041 RepID=A0ABV8RHI6_9SPHN
MFRFLIISFLLFLFGCGDSGVNKRFDENSGDIVNPVMELLKTKDGQRLNLDYIEKYHPNSLVCFFSYYSTTDVHKLNIPSKLRDKYKIVYNMKQLPSERFIEGGQSGLTVISNKTQYNYVLRYSTPVNITTGASNFCVEAKKSFILNIENPADWNNIKASGLYVFGDQ